MKSQSLKSKGFIIIFLIIVLLLSVKYLGFPFQDNYESMPMLYRIESQNYLENDWFTNTNDNFNVRFYYNFALSMMNLLFNSYNILHLFLFLTCNLILLFFIYKISYLVIKDEESSLFTVFLIVMGLAFTLGGNSLIKYTFTPSTIGWLFAIIAIYSFLKNRFVLSSLFLGLSSLFQLLIGLHNFIVFFLVIVFCPVQFNQKAIVKKIKKLIFFSLPFVLVSTINIIPLFISQKNNASHLSAKFIINILRLRLGHHYTPFSWSWSTYVFFAAFFVLFIIAFRKTEIKEIYKNYIKTIVILTFLLFLIGTIFVEFVPITLITKLQLFRNSVLLLFLGYLFIGNFLLKKIKESKNNLEKIFFILFPLSLMYRPIFVVMLGIYLISELTVLISNKDIFSYFYQKKVILFIFVVLIVSTGILSRKIIYDIIQSRPDLFLPYILLPTFFYFGVIFVILSKKTKIHKFILIILVLSTIIFSVYRPPLERNKERSSIQDVYDFIETQTPQDSIFLIPPNLESFRLGANRAIVVDIKAFPLHEKGMVEWYNRINDISDNSLIDKSNTLESYQGLSEKNLIKLKPKYNFSYVLFKKPKTLDFDKVFENEEFVLFKLE